MNKHLSEIIDSIESERRQLVESVTHLSQAQFDFRSSEDAWSIGEVLDHLDLTERGIAKLMKLSAMKSAKSGAQSDDIASDTAGENKWLTSLDHYKIETVTRKLKAIEQIVPRKGLAKNEVLSSLEGSRTELMEAIGAAAENCDFAETSFPHPFLGDFNLYQWVRFIGKHELRLLNQIETVKQSPKFPAPEQAVNQG